MVVAVFPLDRRSMLLPLGRGHSMGREGGPNCRLCHMLAKCQIQATAECPYPPLL